MVYQYNINSALHIKIKLNQFCSNKLTEMNQNLTSACYNFLCSKIKSVPIKKLALRILCLKSQIIVYIANIQIVSMVDEVK